jgi:hypothetical protein|tara:strand:- start:405 stop:965 length:561 start_codon:yes stop_codon:yes gene_type:complete
MIKFESDSGTPKAANIADLVPYKTGILANKDVFTVLSGSTPMQMMNVASNMMAAIAQGVSRKEYLQTLEDCLQTGDFTPVRALYMEANGPELERIAQEETDAITAEMRTAAKNMLGFEKGTARAISEQGTTSISNIGNPPSFQVPDWLFAATEWVKANRDKSVPDMIAALESAPDSEPLRRVQGVE